MNAPISNLYRQLLRRFNFSIGGYSNPEKEVSDFFYKLCKNELIYQNESIRLLMFGFAQLSVNNINEIDLDKWETKPLSKFNYFDYSSGYAEVLLSFYIHCLNEICGNKRATNIISENIRRDINIRIYIDKKETSFQFKENKRLDALEIVVPSCIFNDIDSVIDLNSFKDASSAEIKSFVIQDDDLEHEYKIDSTVQTETKNAYEELAKKVLKIQPKDFLNNISTYLPSKAVQEKIKQRTLRKHDAKLEEILAVAYSASLFCYFFDCTMEYYVSVSNVSLGKKYSLGSIAVGTKNGTELSYDERAMFSIISNHIASNLSAQLVFETNKYLNRDALRKDFIQTCNALDEKTTTKTLTINTKKSDKLHGRDKVEYSDKSNILEIIKPATFGQAFIDKVNACLTNDVFNKNCLIRIRKDDEKRNNHNVKLPNYNFYKDKVNDSENLLLKLIDNQSSNIDFVNLALVEEVLKIFDGIGNYSFSWDKTNRHLDVVSNNSFDLTNFQQRFITEKTGSIYNKIAKELSTPLIAQGNFIILCCNTTEIFNLEKYWENREYLTPIVAQCDCSNFTLRFQLTKTN